MKRLEPAEESLSEFYALPTKHIKLLLKSHPRYALQICKRTHQAVLNSGDKVLIINLKQGMIEGISGLT